jgi:hypothetical protein
VAGCLLLVFVIAVPFVLLFVIGVYAAMLMGGPYYPS